MVNTVVSQPTAASLQLTDYFLTWQGGQSPSTRKTPVSALSPYYATLTGANTFAGKITVSSGGASITGNTNVVGTLSSSGALSAGGTISTSTGGISVAAGGATITGNSSIAGQVSVTGHAMVLDNGQFYAIKDSGGTARGILSVDGSNNVVIDSTTGANVIAISSAGATTVQGALNTGGALTQGGVGVVLNNGATYGINISGTAAAATTATSATTATTATNQSGGTLNATSGNIGSLTTVSSNGSINYNTAGSIGFAWCVFQQGGVTQGSISWTGGGTAFNTSSDETLKLIDGALYEAGPTIDALQPIWFRWKSEPDAPQQPGFGAQTTHAVFPWAVTPGTDGKPWQMDASKLMPLVIAELQALRARVAELEARCL